MVKVPIPKIVNRQMHIVVASMLLGGWVGGWVGGWTGKCTSSLLRCCWAGGWVGGERGKQKRPSPIHSFPQAHTQLGRKQIAHPPTYLHGLVPKHVGEVLGAGVRHRPTNHHRGKREEKRREGESMNQCDVSPFPPTHPPTHPPQPGEPQHVLDVARHLDVGESVDDEADRVDVDGLYGGGWVGGLGKGPLKRLACFPSLGG